MPESAAGAHDRSIRLRGLTFHYRHWGPESAPPIVVLHGLGADASKWDRVAAALADGRRVLALDQRGNGHSDWAAEYSFALMRDDLAAFIDALGLRGIDLVGHSMGGTVAYLYAMGQPSGLRRLVIVDTVPPDPGEWPYTPQPIPPPEFPSFEEALSFLTRAAPEVGEHLQPGRNSE